MKPSITRVMLVSALVAGSACGVDSPSTAIEVMRVAMPNSSCEYDTTSKTYAPDGYYDPTLLSEYDLPLFMRNNLPSSTTTQSAGADDVNLQIETHDAHVQGFQLCWYRADATGAADFSTESDGVSIDCAGLPGDQRAFVGSAVTLEADGGEAIVSVQALTLDALRATGMFGPGFDPMSIPPIGAVAYDANGNGTLTDVDDFYWDPQIEEPSDPNRSGAWGNFPTTTRQLRIYVQARAVAELQTGDVVHSNWFVFGVDVCIGCQSSFCGRLDGFICSGGGLGFQGTVVSLANACVSPQGFGVSCTPYTSCPN